MSVALPVMSHLHLGQTAASKLDLKISEHHPEHHQSHEKPWKYRVSCLHGAQTRCPFVHWKMLVGGPISSRHTCAIVEGRVSCKTFQRTSTGHSGRVCGGAEKFKLAPEDAALFHILVINPVTCNLYENTRTVPNTSQIYLSTIKIEILEPSQIYQSNTFFTMAFGSPWFSH